MSKNYSLSVDGQLSLADINTAITGEEAGASQFLSSAVSADKSSNTVTFKPLAAGTVPNALSLVATGTAAPAGTKQIWTGAMIVSGKSQTIVAYRKT